MASLTFGGNVKRTHCTLCPTRCGMLVEVDESDRPVRFTGDPDNPTANGLLCIKGTVCLDVHDHPQRQNHVLKRVGDRGEGRWERIEWEQALDEIAGKLGRIREQEGPRAMAIMGGTMHGPGEWASWRFAGQWGTSNFVHQGRNCGAGELVTDTAVFGWDTVTSTPVAGVTKCLVAWGYNPAESAPVGWRKLRSCLDQGMKLVVIDPRRTKTAEIADLHIQLRPRTDGALALGMIHQMIQEGIYDREFVERWCTGFDQVREIAAEWTSERTSEITGVPPELIVEAARVYALNRPARLTFGVSAGQIGQGASRSATLGKAILRAISGNLDVHGGEPLAHTHDPAQLAYLDNVGFDNFLNHQHDNVSAVDSPLTSVAGYRAFREAMAKVHPGGHTAAQYMLFASQPHIYRAVLEHDPYPIRAIIVQSGEPLVNYGGARRALEAFTSPELELLVSMDLWQTPTSQLADYVLPAASFLERPELAMSWGLKGWFAVAQQAVQPLYDRHNDYELWAGLGRRLLDPELWPPTLEEMSDRFLAPSGRSYQEWADGERNWYVGPPEYRKYERDGFATPSGKVELIPSMFARFGISPLPTYEGPPYCTPDVDDMDAYPLQMITGSRVRALMGSTLRQTDKLRRIHPEPRVSVHPDDAAAHELSEGDWVWIERPEGSIRQRVSITDTVLPGTIDTAGYWWEPGSEPRAPHLSGVWEANTNSITPSDPRLSSFAGDQPLRGMRCRLRKDSGAISDSSCEAGRDDPVPAMIRDTPSHLGKSTDRITRP